MSDTLPGFAGDIGRVTLWPIAMSASRVKASYRQQNDLGEWAGTSGENAISDANRAPAPAPVHADMRSGVAQTIDVIARAYDPDGDALSIQAGSLTPSTGSASIVGDQVFWTPPTSFTGAATCGFTLRDGGGKTSASKVYAQVAAPTTTPTTYPEAPFTPTSVITATDAADFASKYNTTLAAGQWLRLPAGTVGIPDNFAFNRTFAAPGVAIVGAGMAANGRDPLTVIPSNNLRVTKDRHAFHQLQFTYSIAGSNRGVDARDPFVMRIAAAYFSMTKCWIRGNRGIAFDDNVACHDNYVGWNRFSTIVAQGLQFVRWGLDILPTGSGKHRNSVLAHNFIRAIGPSDDNNAYTIYIGNGHAHGGDDRIILGFKIANNLFDSPAAGWDKAIYLKCGVEEISGNTILNHTQAFIMRHGSLTRTTPASAGTTTSISSKRIWNNWMEVMEFELNGAGHDVRGNYIQCNSGLSLRPGYRRDTAAGQFYDAAHDTLLIGNQVVTGSPSRPAYTLGHNEDGAILDNTRGGKLRGVKVYRPLGDYPPTTVAQMVNDAAFCEADTFTLNAGLGPYADPGMAVKLAQTNVGFKVTGQDNG